MKLVLAIEGSDGSGKTTLANYIAEIGRSYGLLCDVIGLQTYKSDDFAGQLTKLLKASESPNLSNSLSPHSDFHLRIAREYQRAKLARDSIAQIIIFDRFTVSVLSRVLMNGIYSDFMATIFDDISSSASLQATIFCDCPFDITWQRVMRRAANGEQPLSPKEKRGIEYNRELSKCIREAFDLAVSREAKWRIDTSKSAAQSRNELAIYIGPILKAMIAKT